MHDEEVEVMSRTSQRLEACLTMAHCQEDQSATFPRDNRWSHEPAVEIGWLMAVAATSAISTHVALLASPIETPTAPRDPNRKRDLHASCMLHIIHPAIR